MWIVIIIYGKFCNRTFLPPPHQWKRTPSLSKILKPLKNYCLTHHFIACEQYLKLQLTTNNYEKTSVIVIKDIWFQIDHIKWFSTVPCLHPLAISQPSTKRPKAMHWFAYSENFNFKHFFLWLKYQKAGTFYYSKMSAVKWCSFLDYWPRNMN